MAFQKYVSSFMFVKMICRCYIQTSVALFLTKELHPDDYYWFKMKIIIKYIRGTIYLNFTPEALSLALIMWWEVSSFVVYPGFSIHTGSGISLGKAVVTSMSQKHRINTKSSTEANLVGVYDVAPHILCNNSVI